MAAKYLTKIILTNRETGEDQAYGTVDAREILAQKNTQYVLNMQAMAALGFDADYLAARGFRPALPAPAGAVWTPERKAEARAYRAVHGLKKTAEHYGVSQATISKHIPAGKTKLKVLDNWPAQSVRK